MSAELYIDLLGDFRLTHHGEPVGTVNTERLQSLLAYLVLRRGFPQSRPHLAFSFWPDSREKQALSNLRTLLFHLRQALPDPDRFLDVDAKTLTWKADAPCTTDVAQFEASHQEAEDAFQRGDLVSAQMALKRAVAYYRGDLLPSCYDSWILPERERLHQRCTHVLVRLVHLLEDERKYPDALRTAERLLQHDPLREPSYRLLMRLHALNNDRASVARTYQTCVSALRQELDLDPELATHALYEQLTGDREVHARQEHPSEQNVLSGRESNGSPSHAPPGELPLVGRQEEWKALRAVWHEVVEGCARFVTIQGEAGIGKTRLAEEFLEWAVRQGIATARARSYAAEGRLAYAPITEWLRAAVLRSGLARLEAVWLSEVARLLPEVRIDHPELPETPPLVENWQRQRLFEALARALLAEGRPLMLLLDDLQWCDRDTLEWLRFLLRFAPEARLLLVGTVRTEEVDADHPLRTLQWDLNRTGQGTEVNLIPLSESETEQLAAHVAGHTLSEEQTHRLFGETEGNPLFVVESVRAGLPSEPNAQQPERVVSALPATPLPPKVQSVITTRLAQLSPAARAVTSVAAAVGRAFSLKVLLRAGYTDEEQLSNALDELWQRRILREEEPDIFDFTHDKLREVAYAEISPARRQLLHRRIAQALKDIHADSLDTVSARIAAHYDQGGFYEQAIVFYKRAAKIAQGVYADEEVVRLLRRALALLEKLPGNRERDEQELNLLTTLGPALEATRGWAHAEVGATYERALALCRRMEGKEQLFPFLWGVWTFRLVRAELQELQELTAILLRMAKAEQSPSVRSVAAHLAGFFNAFFLGELTMAREHLDTAFALPEFDQHPVHIFLMSADERIFCHCCSAHVLWFLGHPDQALQHATDALDLADASGRPFNRAIARCYLAMLHQYRRENRAAEEQAKAAAALCDEYGFAYYEAWCIIMEGWALADQGVFDEGIAQMHRGVARLRDTGAVLREPYYLALLTKAYLQAGQIDRGLELLTEALETVGQRGEHWIEAELHRLQGEGLLIQDAEDEAEACFRRAEDLADRQQAHSLELRAAMSLGRLWHRQGRTVEAHRHLQKIYSQFTEGHDTPDLKEAATLLAAWA